MYVCVLVLNIIISILWNNKPTVRHIADILINFMFSITSLDFTGLLLMTTLQHHCSKTNSNTIITTLIMLSHTTFSLLCLLYSSLVYVFFYCHFFPHYYLSEKQGTTLGRSEVSHRASTDKGKHL